MEKITLAEKIERATARIADTRRLIAKDEWAIKTLPLEIGEGIAEAFYASYKAVHYDDADKTHAKRTNAIIVDLDTKQHELSVARWDLSLLKKRLANQIAYRNKLIAAHLEIERRLAEEEADIEQLIMLTGAIA